MEPSDAVDTSKIDHVVMSEKVSVNENESESNKGIESDSNKGSESDSNMGREWGTW